VFYSEEKIVRKSLAIFLLAACVAAASAQDISLPAPAAKSGVDLIAAIANRNVARTFAKKAIPMDEISTLLWAGLGTRKADAVTSATKAARNISFSGDNAYINIYYLTEKGSWKYLADSNKLQFISGKDSRSAVSSAAIPSASALILFTVDNALTPSFLKTNPAIFLQMSHATAGFAAQNISLVAASFKLSSIIQYTLSPAGAVEALKLGKEEVPLFIQQLGYAE
jgi:hypothetical protein